MSVYKSQHFIGLCSFISQRKAFQNEFYVRIYSFYYYYLSILALLDSTTENRQERAERERKNCENFLNLNGNTTF